MEYDNTNRGVGFASSGFTGRLNLDGTDYQLSVVGAGDKAKFKYVGFVYNRNETYQFVLFDKDKKSDNSPNYGGSVTLDNGAKYWLSVWHKKSKKGSYFLSISANNADNPVMDNSRVSESDSYNNDIDSEIPF